MSGQHSSIKHPQASLDMKESKDTKKEREREKRRTLIHLRTCSTPETLESRCMKYPVYYGTVTQLSLGRHLEISPLSALQMLLLQAKIKLR